jgi:ABC-type iron transport system FetAB permease component
MDFSRRDVALAMLIVGIVLICASIWIEKRRKHQLMPSLVPPIPLMILGGTIAFFSVVVFIRPN